jgi:hypothetical protein
MSKSEDVNTLYRRFGGNAGTYQEIGANEMAGAATRRWPILGELRPQAHREAPDARKGNTAIGERQVGSFLTPAGGAVNAPPMPEDVGSVAIADEASVAVPQSLPVNVAATVGAEPVVSKPVPEPEPEPVFEPVEMPVVKRTVKTASRPKRAAGSVRAGASKADVVEQPVAQTLKKPAAEKSKKSASAVVLPEKRQTVSRKKASSAPIQDSPSETGSELKSLFNRLVPPKPDEPVAPSSAPLKRLVKW